MPPGCPRCGAATRPGAQWCTLCYADLRPARSRRPEPALVTVPEAAADLAEVSVSLQESPPAEPVPGAPAIGAANRGKHARQVPAAELPPPPPGRGRRAAPVGDAMSTDAMLALLAAETGKPLPGLTGRLESTGARIALMAGGMALFAALLFVVMTVIGSMI